MVDGRDRLSEEEALRVWKRAADLQAATGDSELRAPVASSETAQQTGYDVRQVREAAAGAGIGPEFVALALAEEQDAGPGRGDRIDRWAERLNGRGPRFLVVSRRFDRPIEEVYAVAQRVFRSHNLNLIDSHGQPLDGGLLVFALPSAGAGGNFVVSNLVTRTRVEEIHLRLLPLDQNNCAATLSVPLGGARRAHLGVGAALTAGGGIVGGWAVGALGAALAIPLSIGAAAGAAVIGGAILLGFGAGSGLGVAGSRAVHRSGQRRGTAALERLLQAVGIELRGSHPDTPSSAPSSAERAGTARNAVNGSSRSPHRDPHG
jgi:hypothetical protein